MRAILVPHSDIPAHQQVPVDVDAGRRRRTGSATCSTSSPAGTPAPDRVERSTASRPRSSRCSSWPPRSPAGSTPSCGGGGLVQLPALLVGLPGAARARCWAPTSFARSSARRRPRSPIARRGHRRRAPPCRWRWPPSSGRRCGAAVATHLPGTFFRRSRSCCSSSSGSGPCCAPRSARSRTCAGTAATTHARTASPPSRWAPSSASTTASSAPAPARSSSSASSRCWATRSSTPRPSPRSSTSPPTSPPSSCSPPAATSLWALGLTMGAANLVGGVSARAPRSPRGSGFVRVVFLVVVGVLLSSSAHDVTASGVLAIAGAAPFAGPAAPRCRDAQLADTARPDGARLTR